MQQSGAAFLVVFGVPGIIAFALLHGAGNGMITIAKGTLPLALVGPGGYGLRSGLLSAPARMLQAVSPFLFDLLLDQVGIGAVGLSAGLCLVASARCSCCARAAPSRRTPRRPAVKVRVAGRRYCAGGIISSHGRKVSRGQIGRHRSTFAS